MGCSKPFQCFSRREIQLFLKRISAQEEKPYLSCPLRQPGQQVIQSYCVLLVWIWKALESCSPIKNLILSALSLQLQWMFEWISASYEKHSIISPSFVLNESSLFSSIPWDPRKTDLFETHINGRWTEFISYLLEFSGVPNLSWKWISYWVLWTSFVLFVTSVACSARPSSHSKSTIIKEYTHSIVLRNFTFKPVNHIHYFCLKKTNQNFRSKTHPKAGEKELWLQIYSPW